jgi:hypothetical protein
MATNNYWGTDFAIEPALISIDENDGDKCVCMDASPAALYMSSGEARELAKLLLSCADKLDTA